MPRRTTRLAATDWVDAALGLITTEGVASVKINRLCAVLEVTKGSFYWHFDDIDALWEAMAQRWHETHNSRPTELNALASVPADERVVTLATMLMSDRNLTVETAIRDWARTNPRIAATVQQIDRDVFDVIYSAMIELDLGEIRARLIAGLLVYAGIGYIHGHGSLPNPTPDELRTAISGLLSPARDH
ncbi:DNA-binding transcriptional regulator, AcrR family [Gordonia malaquae]|uniref:Putative TetR family transcriptional regulator n=1 Tax=Gordonia malaquae NBRC 108250 TaxID=1223542 RepID=M3VBJ1_GORML|nr:TetR/AcrR family transcriptional regulator [Gordonia malaquae]GAC80353.1 putative TetR family transcriptional regulator [Gordonia malaquae NBRC 108250]SEB53758.1 DNA-binding transcriptional regulator, AcrR family [Gordonia malaquae]